MSFFFFSSRRRHTRFKCDWSSDVCSSDLIAQVRKPFRNEITPGNFVFRTLEFEQMELEYFVEPCTDQEWCEHWVDSRQRSYIHRGIRPAHLRRSEHPRATRSHHSQRTIVLDNRL